MLGAAHDCGALRTICEPLHGTQASRRLLMARALLGMSCMTTTSKTTCCAIAICASMFAATVSAQAVARATANPRSDSAQPEAGRDEGQPSYQLSASASAGLGAGQPGIGGRIGIGVAYWVTDLAGIGVEGSLMGIGELFGRQSSAEALELVGALRSAPRGDYAVAAIGVGYSRLEHEEGGFCLGEDSSCRSTLTRYDALAVAIALGWLAHPGDAAFEIGPGGRFDVVVDPSGRGPTSYVATLNLSLGLAWLR